MTASQGSLGMYPGRERFFINPIARMVAPTVGVAMVLMAGGRNL
jgi:hypothetical protein